MSGDRCVVGGKLHTGSLYILAVSGRVTHELAIMLCLNSNQPFDTHPTNSWGPTLFACVLRHIHVWNMDIFLMTVQK